MSNGEMEELEPIDLRCYVRDERVRIEIHRPNGDWSELVLEPGLAAQLALALQRRLAEVAGA